MKKGEKPVEPSPADDFDVFEEWEDSPGGAPKESAGEKTDVKIPEPPKPKAPKASPPKAPAAPVKQEVAQMTADVPVQLVAVIGRTTVSVKDLMNYQMGQVIDLGRPPAETVDLVASGKLFARGELVDIEGKLGVRIVKLVK